LLLAGASGEGNGLSFQAQLGYEPALLIRGDDYRRGVIGGGLPNLDGFCYHSHSLASKVGIQTRTGWEMKATLGLTSSIINHGSSNLNLPNDSLGNPWLSSSTDWHSIEFRVGAEVGHRIGFSWDEGDVYLGLEGIWGKFLGKDSLHKNNPESVQDDLRIIHVTSTVKGLQWYIGVSVPVVSFSRFSICLNPLLKGGFITEQSTDIPPDAEWKGPYTLPKCGVALGLTLNYNGGKNK